VSRYLSVAEVIEINAQVTAKFGGLHAVRDANALHAAVGRPQVGYYRDAVEEAAALFESLSQNHPFIDGNKRTAITAAGVALMLNGYELVFDDAEAYEWLSGLYERCQVSKTEVESWFRLHLRTMHRD
jgi:death-on-curing protein